MSARINPFTVRCSAAAAIFNRKIISFGIWRMLSVTMCSSGSCLAMGRECSQTLEGKAIRPADRSNPYLFPGLQFEKPLTDTAIFKYWRDLREIIGIPGLWNYDLRRSLATILSNELKYRDAVIDAILGHEKTTSLGHYLHVSFDAMTEPIQHYADWLCGLQRDPVEQQLLSILSPQTAIRSDWVYSKPHPIDVLSQPEVTPSPTTPPIAYGSHRYEREEWPG